jgi:hypothetical protein
VGLRAAGAAVLLVLLACGSAEAGKGSLYRGAAHRPGPDILYAKPAKAPQLANKGVWHARPILVSGTTAYRRGEFLYQDYLYDDHGARSGGQDPGDPRAGSDTFSRANGSYLYPTDPAYANNAADIVELRIRPLKNSTAFRITYNSMTNPGLVASTIALGSSPQPVAFPHGANVKAPAALFLTVHGKQADLIRASDGTVVGGAKVRVNVRRRQVELFVRHRKWNPHRRTVRIAMGSGLWDNGAGRYLLPQAARTTTVPGGAGPLVNPPAFFNVAFRAGERVPNPRDPAGTASDPAWWRDSLQGTALAAGDISPFFANVSFKKLSKRRNDNSQVPYSGGYDRILASHFERSQGVDYGSTCIQQGILDETTGCVGIYRGQLQPYAIYVPNKPTPRGGFGMTLLLHSLAGNYNQYLGSHHQVQFAERGRGSIAITPLARGPDGGYLGYAAADTFEVWADVARRYRLDPEWTVTTGYSMGAIGSFRLGNEFPDLFAKMQPTVGSEQNTYRLASLRNVPVLMWNGTADELQGPEFFLPVVQKLDDLGYRYELDQFTPGEHLSLAINDEYAPAAAFLGSDEVDRNPFHVTYVVDPELYEPKLGIVADHAYWLSNMRVRGPGHGQIDAISRGFGQTDPQPQPTQTGVGGLAGGSLLNPYPFTSRKKTWGPGGTAPKQNALVINAENLSAATINVRRAHVACNVSLQVKTDGPLTIHLTGKKASKKAKKGAVAAKKRPRGVCRRTVKFP